MGLNGRNRHIVLLLILLPLTVTAQDNRPAVGSISNAARGTLALREGDWAKAAKYLEAAAHSEPGDAGIRFYLAQAYYLQGEIPAALHTIAEAARLAPADAEIARKQGQYLADQGSPKGLEELLRAKKLDPALPDIEFDIGVAQFRTGQLAAARNSLGAELQQNPNHVEASFFLAEVFSRLAKTSGSDEQWTQAEEFYRKAISRGGGTGEAYFGLGRAMIALRQPAEAIPVLQKAVNLDPSILDVHFELAKAYKSLGEESNRQHEIEVFRGAMDRKIWVDPVIGVRDAKSQQVWQELKSLVETDEEQALLAHLRQSAGNEDIWLAAGAVYYAMSRPGQATRMFQRGITQEPTNAALHAWLGLALIGQPNEPRAEAELNKALELDPRNRTALLGLGELRYSQSRWSDAARYLDESQSKQPEVLVKLCHCYVRLGEREKALVTAELLRVFAPADRQSIEAINRILGRDREAQTPEPSHF